MFDGVDWVDLVGQSSDYLSTTFNLINGITPGAQIQFRVRARNVYGWQPLFSDPDVTIIASEAPGQMETLVTSYDEMEDAYSIKITWQAPDANSETI